MSAPTKTPSIGDNSRPLVTASQLADEYAHVERFVAELEAEAAKAPPVLEDDEDLAIVNEIVPKLTKALRRADTLREDAKRPFLDAGNTVQAFFRDGFLARMQRLKGSLEGRGTVYLNKKRQAELDRQREIERQQREEAARKAAEAAEMTVVGNLTAAEVAADQARDAANRADDAAQASTAKPAEMARTHTTAGTATLADDWEFKIDDFSKIDVEKLRNFFAPNDVRNAVARFVKAGGRELAGVTITHAPKARFTS